MVSEVFKYVGISCLTCLVAYGMVNRSIGFAILGGVGVAMFSLVSIVIDHIGSNKKLESELEAIKKSIETLNIDHTDLVRRIIYAESKNNNGPFGG